jgi:predicted nucleotidyltransferase
VNLQRPFEVVSPTLDGDVLMVLAQSDRALTGRAIEREIAASHTGIRRALDHLVAQGIVIREPAGRAHLYRLNRAHLACPWIEGLAGLRSQLVDRLREAIDDWSVRPMAAVLFGSVARREANRDSDIDILIVRPDQLDAGDEDWRDRILALQTNVAAWTGNDARVLEFGELELSAEPVVAAAAAEGIELHGSLRRLLARPRRPG